MTAYLNRQKINRDCVADLDDHEPHRIALDRVLAISMDCIARLNREILFGWGAAYYYFVILQSAPNFSSHSTTHQRMQISIAVLGLVALMSPSLSALAAPGKPLPWDGRGNDLVEAMLNDKYNTDILTQRNGASNGYPADYVTIQADGRSPAYNGDSGVINIGVDSGSIYGTDKSARRSELVQTVTANPTGTTFFRASIMKDNAFKYSLGWKVIFPESNLFDIHVDGTTDMPKIMFLTNGTEKAHWTSRIKVDTWYNFGIGVLPSKSGSGTKIELYTSTGNEDLVLNVTAEVKTPVPTSYEMHYGLFTQTKSKTGPLMTTKQEVMAFNGVSVDNEVVTAATVVVPEDAGSAISR